MLGWSIDGSVKKETTKKHLTLQTTNYDNKTTKNENTLEEMHNLMKEYFDLDALGVSLNKRENAENKKALDILHKTSCYKNDHWEVGLLWKNDDATFPNSRPNALSKLRLLERKLDRDPQYAKLYYKEMERLLENGFTEKTNRTPCEKL